MEGGLLAALTMGEKVVRTRRGVCRRRDRRDGDDGRGVSERWNRDEDLSLMGGVLWD